VHFRNDLLLTRFAGLPAHGLRCAQAASVMGDRFATEVVTEVAQLDPAMSDAAFEALWTSGLVRRGPAGSAEFAHPMFCQALYEDMPEPLRVRLHARTFDVLARRGMDAAAAEHAIRGGLVGDPTAIGVLEHAGRQALRVGAPGTAAQHLGAAVTFSGERAGAPLLMAAGEALLAAGQPAEAMAAYERVLSDPGMTCELRVEALRMLGRALFGTGDHERAALRFEEAIELGRQASPGPEKPIELLLDYALSSWSAEGPVKSLPLAVRARELATMAATDPAIQRRAEATWGFLALLSGDGSGLETVRAASRAVEADPLSNQVELCWTGSALTIHGYAAMCTECFDEAERVLDVALSAARHIGAAHAVATIEMAMAGTFIRRGRLADALEHLRQADQVSDLFPMIQSVTRIRHALLLLHDGRWEESEVQRREVEELARARGQGLAMLWAHYLQGLSSVRAGDLAGACGAYARAEELTHRMGVGEPCAVPWAGDAVTAYLRIDRVDDARRVVAWLDACAERLPCRWPRIAAAGGRALLAAQAGDHAGAEAGFLLALRLHDEIELPLERVGTLLDYGALLRRLGQPVRARAFLAEALQVAETCGSVWLAARAREDLAAAGGRRRRLRASDQLTGQEERVARLAATGKTNQDIARELFLAVRTIETHLERIYSKLGIHSRRELIATPSRIDGSHQART
jgi:DNA-binding CsgD family transcriptional regulator